MGAKADVPIVRDGNADMWIRGHLGIRLLSLPTLREPREREQSIVKFG